MSRVAVDSGNLGGYRCQADVSGLSGLRVIADSFAHLGE